jgi:hypothetical protein
MTIPQLKGELIKRGVSGTSKMRKAELQKALKDAVKDSISTSSPSSSLPSPSSPPHSYAYRDTGKTTNKEVSLTSTYALVLIQKEN